MIIFQFLLYLFTSPSWCSHISFPKDPSNYFVGSYFFVIFAKTLKMEKLSHWADVLKWLEKVVDSCKTRSHFRNCENLISNFHRLYKERIGESNCYELTRNIRHKLIDIEYDWMQNKLKK